MGIKIKNILIAIQEGIAKLQESQNVLMEGRKELRKVALMQYDIEDLKQEVRRIQMKQEEYEKSQNRSVKDALIAIKESQIDEAIERVKNRF